MRSELGATAFGRLLRSIAVVFGVISIVFFLSRGAGDPVSRLAPIDATQQEIEEAKERYGLNDPMIEQYGRFLWDIVRLEFGQSFRATTSGDRCGRRASGGDRPAGSGGTVRRVCDWHSVRDCGCGASRRRDRHLQPDRSAVRSGGAQLLARPDVDPLRRVVYRFHPDRRPHDAAEHHLAGDHAGIVPCGGGDAIHPLGHARHVAAGLHPHGASQGSDRARRAVQARPAQLDARRDHVARVCRSATSFPARSSSRPFSPGRGWDS